MGILLSRNWDSESSSNANAISIDLENAMPTSFEEAVYEKVTAMFGPSAQILAALKNYKGCSEAIRSAISKPSEEAERALWAELVPCVDSLEQFYDFSLQIEKMLNSLIKVLCEGDPLENLKQYQALARKLADIIHFAIVFDDVKMAKPDIQNDFSYYRRSLPKIKAAIGDGKLKVQDDLANKMSLFYAYPTPMMRAVISAMLNFIAADATKGATISTALSSMIKACMNALTKNSVSDKKFCLYVMVACLVLYDHVNENGAFVKGSPINIKQVKKLIEIDGGVIAEPLLNCLRYTTKHLNDESTPKATKSLLIQN